MATRRLTLCALLLAAGCARGPAPTPPVVSSLPTSASCGGIGPAPGSAEVTFVKSGRLWAASPDGTGVRCLQRVSGASPLEWAAGADRVLVGASLTLPSGRPVDPLVPGAAKPEWSRPAGKALVYTEASGALVKRPVAAPVQQLSVLTHHTEVVYHPAGTHIAVAGDQEGTPVIVLASNTGADARPLAVGESAKRLYGLSFSHNGVLYFAGDHGSRHDLHTFNIPDNQLSTVDTSKTPYGAVVASEFAPDLVAFRRGACGASGGTYVRDGGSTKRVDGEIGGVTRPAGWLPDGRLLLLARQSGCSGPASLYVWSSGSVTRLIDGVRDAAVRVVMPPPPEPPIPGSGAA